MASLNSFIAHSAKPSVPKVVSSVTNRSAPYSGVPLVSAFASSKPPPPVLKRKVPTAPVPPAPARIPIHSQAKRIPGAVKRAPVSAHSARLPASHVELDGNTSSPSDVEAAQQLPEEHLVVSQFSTKENQNGLPKDDMFVSDAQVDVTPLEPNSTHTPVQPTDIPSDHEGSDSAHTLSVLGEMFNERKLASYWMLLAAQAWAEGRLEEGKGLLEEASRIGAEVNHNMFASNSARYKSSPIFLAEDARGAYVRNIPIRAERWGVLYTCEVGVRYSLDWKLLVVAGPAKTHSAPTNQSTPNDFHHSLSAFDGQAFNKSPLAANSGVVLHDGRSHGDLTTTIISPVRGLELDERHTFRIPTDSALDYDTPTSLQTGRNGALFSPSSEDSHGKVAKERLRLDHEEDSKGDFLVLHRPSDIVPTTPTNTPLTFVVQTPQTVQASSPLLLRQNDTLPRTRTPRQRRLFDPPQLVEAPDRRRSAAVREIVELLGAVAINDMTPHQVLAPTTPRLKREMASIGGMRPSASVRKSLALPDGMVPVEPMAGEVEGSSITVLTPVRAKPKERGALGTSMYVTQVRRSLRHLPLDDELRPEDNSGDEDYADENGSPGNSVATSMEPSENGRKLHKLLEDNAYAYKPNKAIDQQQSLAMLRGQLMK
ncbi:hypothetical protein HDU93_002589 [Gonapodya sp. JEL0774]|nr:hypothetical protein HDU93_002589 [Gonapodya sp. JEL0774]